MEHLCLRNCFVEDRYFTKGDVYDLADEFPKYEKNFRLAGASPQVAEVTNKPQRALKPGEYLCLKCSTIHRESSKLGVRHLKHKKES